MPIHFLEFKAVKPFMGNVARASHEFDTTLIWQYMSILTGLSLSQAMTYLEHCGACMCKGGARC